jgi:hypothetical protein
LDWEASGNLGLQKQTYIYAKESRVQVAAPCLDICLLRFGIHCGRYKFSYMEPDLNDVHALGQEDGDMRGLRLLHQVHEILGPRRVHFSLESSPS